MISDVGSSQVGKNYFPAAKTADMIKEGIVEFTG
jgi:hypothetical protein